MPVSVTSSLQSQPFGPVAVQTQVTILVMVDRQGVCLAVTPGMDAIALRHYLFQKRLLVVRY